MNYKTKANRIGNESLAKLGMRMIDTVDKSGNEDAKVSKFYVNLVDVNARYQIAIEVGNEKQVKEAIDAKYNERNVAFMQMYSYVQGLLNSPDADMKAAAILLFEQLDKYGKNFSKDKIADQSLHYGIIIEALKRPEFTVAKIKTLLTNGVANLNQLQLDYELLYMGRGNTTATKIAASNLRQEMEKAIKLYLDEVTWMANSTDNEAWITLRSTIEQRFNEVNVSMTRKKDSSTAEENTSPPATV